MAPQPDRITPFSGIIDFLTSLSGNGFPNKLTPSVINNTLRNPTFCSLASILIVSLTPFLNKPNYSRDLTVFMIPFLHLRLEV